MMNQDRVTEYSGIDNIGNTADSSHTDSIDMKIESRYLEQALRLHKQHPVVDMHLDLAGELVLRHELGEQNVLYHRYLKNFYQAGIRVIASSIYVANCDLDHAWANALMQIKLLKGEIVTCNLELQRSREPCRLPFEANALPEGKPGRLHHLSLKDNSAIDKLDKLQALGVASAKIEGRLRTPEYVAAAVSACLAGREGRAYDRDLLKNAFSRSGFTSGYLDGKIDGTMFGVRSEADAELTKKTLPMLRELYRRERSRVPVQMKLEIEEGGEKLTVTDADGNKAFAYGDAEPQPARTDPTESLNRSLTKTGGTPFAAEKITVEMDGGPWFIPGSAVNELRREALDALLKKREALRPWPTTEEHVAALPQRTLPPRRTLRARFERWEQVPERALDGVEYLILPIAQADRVPREWRAKTLLELPRVMFGALEQDTARRIAATQDAGFAGYEVSNIAHLRLCRGLPMTGGFGLNITNNVAAQFYAEQGLSSLLILPEVKDSDIASIAPTRNGKPVPTGVMIYGHMPLMLTRACPLQNIHDCAHCNKTGVLTDRKAKKFPVRCGLGVRTIYNPVPIYMGDKPGALAVDYGVAYFTLESREEAAQILDSIRTHAPFEGDFTRGLYFKGTN